MRDSTDQAPGDRLSTAGAGPASGSAGLALLFRDGARCDAAALDRPEGAFALVGRPPGDAAPATVLMAGFRFALVGLAPGPAVRVAAPRHGFDLMLPTLARAEAVRVAPAGGLSPAPRPVLRALVALGCELAALPGLAGLGWEAAGTVMSPAYYLRIMQAWLRGGAFPGLGLAALVKDTGALRSEGLALFTGHELSVGLSAGGSAAGAAKLALRAMHALVEDGIAPEAVAEHLGLAGVPSAFSRDDRLLRIG